MVFTRGRAPLRIAYIEDNRQDAASLCESWAAFRPRIQNPLVVYESAEAFLNDIQGPFAPWPDILLVDLSLPGKSGVDLIQVCKGQHELAHVPIVILTGSDEDTAESIARLTGAEAFASKPVKAPGILKVIGEITREHPEYGIEIVKLDPPPSPTMVEATA